MPKAGSRALSPFPRHGFVVKTEYRNERNYINAFLCDSAIALRGGPGTDSEVAFCLGLGGPSSSSGPNGLSSAGSSRSRPARGKLSWR